MRISKVWLKNWTRYRGEHSIELEAGAHGVVATHESDPRRSNWLGKSALAWAIRFAVTGERPKDARLEDDWITRGENDGAVRLLLSDGLVIERSRQRGRATRLAVHREAKSGESSTQAEAQALVDRWIGLGSDDVDLWYVAQKQTSAFVVAKPAERMALLAGWLRLGPLRAAERRAKECLAELVDREARLVSAAERKEESAREILEDAGVEEGSEAISALKIQEMRATKAAARAGRLHDEARDTLEKEISLANDRRTAAHAAALEKELAELERRSGTAVERSEIGRRRDRAERAAAVLNEKTKEAEAARRLACGRFDGECPVGRMICPVAGELNARREENAKIAREAEGALAAARSEHAAARSARDEAESEQRRALEAKAKVESLRSQIARAYPARRRAKEAGPGEDVAALRELALRRLRERDEAIERSTAAERRARDYERLVKEAAEYRERLGEVRREAALVREAAEIVGRRGAQRVIAETSLAAIVSGANVLLSDAGIELSIAASWARETGELAAACACGASFPRSTRVRECARCGEERGAKLDERLELELSSRSGAAEDLAGLAITLSASSWLRRQRGAGWGVLVLDEPFGALDAAHRASLARGLVGALSGHHGCEQSLVIAHHDGILDGLPGRVSIVADDEGSRLERRTTGDPSIPS